MKKISYVNMMIIGEVPEQKKEFPKIRFCSIDKYRTVVDADVKAEIVPDLCKHIGKVGEVKGYELEKDSPRGKWTKFVFEDFIFATLPAKAAQLMDPAQFAELIQTIDNGFVYVAGVICSLIFAVVWRH